MLETKKKFAWFPTMVETWRSQRTKALIWLQHYYIKGDDMFFSLNDDGRRGHKYILELGFFSHEFYRR